MFIMIKFSAHERNKPDFNFLEMEWFSVSSGDEMKIAKWIFAYVLIKMQIRTRLFHPVVSPVQFRQKTQIYTALSVDVWILCRVKTH